MYKLIAGLVLAFSAFTTKADPVVALEFQSIAYQAVAEQLVKQKRVPLVSTITSISSTNSQQFYYTYQVYDNGPKCFKSFADVSYDKNNKPEVTFYRVLPQEVDCK